MNFMLLYARNYSKSKMHTFTTMLSSEILINESYIN